MHSVKFNPSGQALATAGYDHDICEDIRMHKDDHRLSPDPLTPDPLIPFTPSLLLLPFDAHRLVCSDLWNIYGDAPQNYALLKAHKKDVMEVAWSADGS